MFVLSVYGGLTFITVLSLVPVDAVVSFDNRQVLIFDEFGLKVHVSALMEVLGYRWQRPALDKEHDDDDDNGSTTWEAVSSRGITLHRNIMFMTRYL